MSSFYLVNLYGKVLFYNEQYDIQSVGKIDEEYEQRFLLRCIHHFKSDLINNMDHMRISGNEPSSVILSQKKWFQTLKMIARKCQIKVKPNGMV